MTDRRALARAFLDRTNWSAAQVSSLAGDASNRKYFRLTQAGSNETAVLMDAPPAKGEDTQPFVEIAQYLTGIGLSAPHILASDQAQGFLLLEDLGDALFARVIPDDPASEPQLYTAATDVLIALHDQTPKPGLKPYDPPVMADMAALAFDWYASGTGQQTSTVSTVRDTFRIAIKAVLAQHANQTDVLIQRDYHAENLLWIPDRTGIARVGLLDFQDAMLGHRAYDLVSLLQDARRDVPERIQTEMIQRYIAVTGADQGAFETAYTCLGAQRSLRILGVFARLCIRDGKPGYIDLIPRVWAHLQNNLAHPGLNEIRDILKDTLPNPTPQFLRALKEKCATVPAL